MIRVPAVLLIAAALFPASSSTPIRTNPTDATRAEASFDALQKAFGTADGSGLYRELYPAAPQDHPYSFEWPFSQVHVAVLDLSGLPGREGGSYLHRLDSTDASQRHYWSGSPPGGHPGFLASPLPPYGKTGTLFYDDNEWAGLEAVQDYAQRHGHASLHEAEQIFALAVSGWDRDASHAAHGGVFWTQAKHNDDRNTVSNMPAAELGLRIYQVTGQKSYLSWAKRMYRWTNRTLQRPDGLFYDHVDLKGRVDRSMWTYNQGVPIAVNRLLSRITGDRSYLRESERIASAAYRHFIAGDRLQSQPVVFNAIFFKHLLALEASTGGSRYRTAMQTYADMLWDRSRDPRTGVFRFGTDHRTDVIDQAAATQIFAILAWPRAALADLA